MAGARSRGDDARPEHTRDQRPDAHAKLGDGALDRFVAWPKIDRLHRLARAGLPVPPGVIVGLEERIDAQSIWSALAAGDGLMVRVALAEEDRAGHIHAGVGRSSAATDLPTFSSILDSLRDRPVHADRARAVGLREDGRAIDHEAPAPALLVQRRVPRTHLVVTAWDERAHADLPPRAPRPWTQDDAAPPAWRVDAWPRGVSAETWVEAYGPVETLDEGAPPIHAGPLCTVDEAWAEATRALVDAAATVLGAQAAELELIFDGQSGWLVQARPFTGAAPRALTFLALARSAGARVTACVDPRRERVGPPLAPRDVTRGPWPAIGTWSLDAEHNDRPVSTAHEWLVAALSDRGALDDITVVAGWIYMRDPPLRARLGGDSARQDGAGGAPEPDHDVLARRIDVYRQAMMRARVRARAAASAFGERSAPDGASLSRADVDALWANVEAALVLADDAVRARAHARIELGALSLRSLAAARSDDAASLADPRTRPATALVSEARGGAWEAHAALAELTPWAWDVASPSLAQLGLRASPPSAPESPALGRSAESLVSADAALVAALARDAIEIDDQPLAIALMCVRAAIDALADAVAAASPAFAPRASAGGAGATAAELLAPSPRYMITPDEWLAAASRRAAGQPSAQIIAELEQLAQLRTTAWHARAHALPAARFIDGMPAFAAPRPLVGHPIGPSTRGRLVFVDVPGEPPHAREASGDGLRTQRARPHGAPARSEDACQAPIACLRTVSAGAVAWLVRAGFSGVVTEFGGALSHVALMLAELELPGIIGCAGCTSIAADSLVELDTRSGALRVLAGPRRE